MARAFQEIARVLRPAGTVLFVNADPERPDFISPHSTHYHTVVSRVPGPPGPVTGFQVLYVTALKAPRAGLSGA